MLFCCLSQYCITITLVSKYESIFAITSLIKNLVSKIAGPFLAAVIVISTLDMIWRGSECGLMRWTR